MKITKVDVLFPRTSIGACIGCRVYTDEGIYGDGEASLFTGMGAEAGVAMIERAAKFVIGQDPLHSDAIWDSLSRLQSTFWGQNGGPVVYGAISAIDIALWDIKGKYYHAPICELLGGKRRSRIWAYGSQPQFGWGDSFELAKEPEDYAKYAKMAVDSGYDAVKIDFLWGTPEYDLKGLLPAKFWEGIEKKVSAVRETLGPDVDIIVEDHGTTDKLSVLQMAKWMEKYNIFYLEEPTVPDAKLTKYISDRTTIPIASGERIQNRWQYRPYLEDQALSIIQPDVGTCGGITELKRICDMAAVYDVGVQPHNCHGPISNAATLHVEANIYNFVIHEDCTRGGLMKTTLLDGSPLCTNFFAAKDGYMPVPEGDGLGVEWSEETMASSIVSTVTEEEAAGLGLVKTFDETYYEK